MRKIFTIRAVVRFMSSVNNQTIIDEYFFWYSENIRERIETQKGARILRYQFLEVYGNKDLLAIDKADVLRYLNFVKNGKYTPAGKDKKNELKPYAPQNSFRILLNSCKMESLIRAMNLKGRCACTTLLLLKR